MNSLYDICTMTKLHFKEYIPTIKEHISELVFIYFSICRQSVHSEEMSEVLSFNIILSIVCPISFVTI